MFEIDGHVSTQDHKDHSILKITKLSHNIFGGKL
jgi:hypothetical protein